MPRTPTYGRATGPGDAVGSSIYEMYAPQRAATEFGVDYARTGFEFQKEVEFEKQRQLDAQIAQSQLGRDLQKQEAAKRRKKGRKGQKVSSAATGATILGSFVPGVGHVAGAALGWLFGQEGGMVPAINPDSLLYKQYQAGGDVTGYSGGQPKFLRRGYQNLQFRQEDLSRAQENLDKMKAYGFWDAARDVGKGYMAGKALTPEIEKFTDLAGATLGVAKEHGWGTAWDILTGKSTPGTGFPGVPAHLPMPDISMGPSLSDAKSTYLAEVMEKRKGMDIGAELEAWKKKAGAVVKKPTTPARKSIYTKGTVQKAIRRGGPSSLYSGLFGGSEAAGGIQSDPLSWWESGGN